MSEQVTEQASEQVKLPEVGDIWKRNGNCRRGSIYRVVKVTDNIVIWLDDQLERNVEDLQIFTECYTYIGKAKNPITSIFEVE